MEFPNSGCPWAVQVESSAQTQTASGATEERARARAIAIRLEFNEAGILLSDEITSLSLEVFCLQVFAVKFTVIIISCVHSVRQSNGISGRQVGAFN